MKNEYVEQEEENKMTEKVTVSYKEVEKTFKVEEKVFHLELNEEQAYVLSEILYRYVSGPKFFDYGVLSDVVYALRKHLSQG